MDDTKYIYIYIYIYVCVCVCSCVCVCECECVWICESVYKRNEMNSNTTK